MTVHILEYENYGGYDKTIAKLRASDVRRFFRQTPRVTVGDASGSSSTRRRIRR